MVFFQRTGRRAVWGSQAVRQKCLHHPLVFPPGPTVQVEITTAPFFCQRAEVLKIFIAARAIPLHSRGLIADIGLFWP